MLPFAVGLYLPIYLSTPIMVGGLVRLYFDKNTSPPILPRLIIFDILITSPRVSAPTGIIANTAKRIPTSPSQAIRPDE